ncbi:MAG: cation:proton antiporter [bacterium]|jgi:hypothetical protein|nr:cation:proton antiporter [Betaproteobacteria bacterium]
MELLQTLVLLLFLAVVLGWLSQRAGLPYPIALVLGGGLLALGLVVPTTLAVGCVVKLLPPGMPWAVAFALGPIVSPTDAGATSAMLSGMHLPRRVMSVTEGESLVNEATGLVLSQARYRLAEAALEELDRRLAERCTHEDIVRAVAAEYRARLATLGPHSLVMVGADEPLRQTRRVAVQAERRRLIELWRAELIGDEVLPLLERELDLEESRLG